MILGPHDVKVRMKAVGICGSDVHHFKIRRMILICLKTMSNLNGNKRCLCLICNTNVLQYFQHMRCANFIVKKPMVIGHECAGVIDEIGSEVKTLQVGDRVAVEPGISCGQCRLCKDGRYNLCREMKFFGSPPTNGALANLVTCNQFCS